MKRIQSVNLPVAVMRPIDPIESFIQDNTEVGCGQVQKRYSAFNHQYFKTVQCLEGRSAKEHFKRILKDIQRLDQTDDAKLIKESVKLIADDFKYKELKDLEKSLGVESGGCLDKVYSVLNAMYFPYIACVEGISAKQHFEYIVEKTRMFFKPTDITVEDFFEAITGRWQSMLQDSFLQHFIEMESNLIYRQFYGLVPDKTNKLQKKIHQQLEKERWLQVVRDSYHPKKERVVENETATETLRLIQVMEEKVCGAVVTPMLLILRKAALFSFRKDYACLEMLFESHQAELLQEDMHMQEIRQIPEGNLLQEISSLPGGGDFFIRENRLIYESALMHEPLVFYASYGHFEKVKMLLMDEQSQEVRKWAFTNAVFRGYLSIARFLKQSGKIVSLGDQGRFLQFATMRKKVEIVRFLLEHAGKAIAVADKDKALQWSVQHNDLEMLKELFLYHEGQKEISVEGEGRALQFAFRKKQHGIEDFLLGRLKVKMHKKEISLDAALRIMYFVTIRLNTQEKRFLDEKLPLRMKGWAALIAVYNVNFSAAGLLIDSFVKSFFSMPKVHLEAPVDFTAKNANSLSQERAKVERVEVVDHQSLINAVKGSRRLGNV